MSTGRSVGDNPKRVSSNGQASPTVLRGRHRERSHSRVLNSFDSIVLVGLRSEEPMIECAANSALSTILSTGAGRFSATHGTTTSRRLGADRCGAAVVAASPACVAYTTSELVEAIGDATLADLVCWHDQALRPLSARIGRAVAAFISAPPELVGFILSWRHRNVSIQVWDTDQVWDTESGIPIDTSRPPQ